MGRCVAVPPACLVSLRDRDDEEWPTVALQCPPNDCLPVPQPRSMDEGAPAAPAVPQLAMNGPAAARAELAVVWQRRRPDPGDDLFGSPEGGPLLIGVGRNDPRLPSTPARPFDGKQPELSLRSVPGLTRSAPLSAAPRFAGGQLEARRPAASVRALVRDHHRPRATRVRIPYAPPQAWEPRSRFTLRGDPRFYAFAFLDIYRRSAI